MKWHWEGNVLVIKDRKLLQKASEMERRLYHDSDIAVKHYPPGAGRRLRLPADDYDHSLVNAQMDVLDLKMQGVEIPVSEIAGSPMEIAAAVSREHREVLLKRMEGMGGRPCKNCPLSDYPE